MAVIVGNGTTLVFETTAFAGELIAIPNISGIEREVIETTILGLVAPGANQIGNRTYLPSTAVGPIVIEARYNHDPDLIPPLHAAAETITITWPLPAGGLTAATWAGLGFMISYNTEGIILDGKVESVSNIQMTGPMTVTAST